MSYNFEVPEGDEAEQVKMSLKNRVTHLIDQADAASRDGYPEIEEKYREKASNLQDVLEELKTQMEENKKGEE